MLVIINCFVIYNITSNNNKNIVALGDSSCTSTSLYGAKSVSYNTYLSSYLKAQLNDSYCQDNLFIEDLITNIKNNISINNKHILSDLDKADYITIMIGYDELTSYKDVNNIIKRDFVNNYISLLDLIRNNSKAKIYVIGFYPNYFRNYKEINRKIKNACDNRNITFINTEKINKNNTNFYNIQSYKLTGRGNLELFKIIHKKL